MQLGNHGTAVREQAFSEDEESVYLLDELADGHGQWWQTFCEMLLDGVRCFVHCQFERCALQLLLPLDVEGSQADRKNADAIMVCFKHQAWSKFVVYDVVE